MSNINFKKNVLAVAVVMVSGYMGSASAHNQPSLAGLGVVTATDAVDLYHTTCFSWGIAPYIAAVAPEVNGAAHHLRAGIRRTSGTAVVKVTVTKGGVSSASTDNNHVGAALGANTDAVLPPAPPFNGYGDGSAGWAQVNGGNGDYYMFVTHGGSGASNYNVNFHCENAARVHTGTGTGLSGGAPTADYLWDNDAP